MMVPQQGQTYLRELDPPPLPGTLQRIGTGPNQTEPGFAKGFHEGFSLRVQGGFVPPVLFAFLHGQPVGFSGFLELPVVVGTRTGSVLNIVLKVLKVNHFVKQGSTGFFKGAVQVFGAQVDFVIAAFLGAVLPRLPTGTPPIGPTGMIRGNGDHRLFQLPFKEGFVEL